MRKDKYIPMVTICMKVVARELQILLFLGDKVYREDTCFWLSKESLITDSLLFVRYFSPFCSVP